jgi:hypothetical protein
MKKVSRSELLDLGAYEQIRQQFRARVITEKKARRFSPTPELSVVFENHDTVLLQVQEMLRTERITKEAGIEHELETYNQLIPGEGEISATMFVEIPEREERERRLVELAGLEGALALEIDGTVFPARNETHGVLPDRTTAVHYLKFPVGPSGIAALKAAGSRPGAVAFLVRHPKLEARVPLPAEALRALIDDLDPSEG